VLILVCYDPSLQTFAEIVDFLDASGLVRQEPLLVVGGGLVTDVAGYVCASYRRSTPFIRVPTTLIGLIDASVSIKVGLNHKKLKNRLGEWPVALSLRSTTKWIPVCT